ncbi:MAG: ribose-phosphate pyrophosphokinae [Fibrobacteres bacterium]|nr:ribose-phosphate pyrophosphokinae [Fibrobacterota bacterium]
MGKTRRKPGFLIPGVPVENGILFAIRSYADLGKDIAGIGGFEYGNVKVRVWPGGELYQEVETPPSGRDVYLVAGTGTEAETLEAFDLANALVQQGALSLTIAIPFFGYSTMERARLRGEAVTAKSRARLWDSLPRAPMGNRILILEPHTQSLPHYFSGPNIVSALDAGPLMTAILDQFPAGSAMLCSPDIGRIKWVDRLASSAGRDSAFVLKRRVGTGVQVFGLSGEVAGRMIVICDDMIRTGGTLINAAKACVGAGAAGISAAAIHGAFAPGSLEKLRDCGLFNSLHCTDSHPNALGRQQGWPELTSCAGLLAGALAPA